MLSTAIQYFISVAQSGSFSQAAQKNFVSQPAVSKQIALLEEELGFALLERNTRPITLTERGRIIYFALLEELDIWNKAVEEAKSLSIGTQKLRVGILNGWSMKRMPIAKILDFQEQYPDIQLSVHQFSYRELTQKLLNQQLDIILTLRDELVHQTGLSWRKAFEIELVIYVSAAHPFGKLDKLPDDFNGINTYILDKQASLSSIPLVQRIIQSNKWNMNIQACPNVDSIFTAVEQEKGCAWTLKSSRIFESASFKALPFSQRIETVFAWNVNNYSYNVNLFLETLEFNKYNRNN